MAAGATRIGRYAIGEAIAHGGMATVCWGRALGAAGFSRTVAIKRLHAQYALDPDFVAMMLDEAMLASHLHHPNVVGTIDVVAEGEELLLVLEYVHGESLAALLGRTEAKRLEPALGAAIALDVLYGLQAAHDARDDEGKALGIVHRDVSPQNILVGADGVARVADFGIAKATVRLQTTREGQVKGKLRYMAPEQLRGDDVTAAADVYSVGVLLWEMLTGRRLFDGDTDAVIYGRVLEGVTPPPSRHAPGLGAGLEAVVLTALERNVDRRFPAARAMARALESAVQRASPAEVGAWVQGLAGETLATRAKARRAEEAAASEDTATRPEAAPVVAAQDDSTAPALRSAATVAASPRARTAVIGVAAAAVVVALTLVAVREAPREPAASPATVVGEPLAPTATADPTPPPGSPTVDAIATATATAVPSASVRPRLPPPRPTATAVDCNPPWFVDAQGIQRVKRGCL
jgi:eukaryotic-like serine/threonine-protein kinase